MKLLIKGKTKNIYELDDGNYLLKFKDDVTGEDGRFDPGANTIMGEISGMGKASLRMSEYYFNLLAAQNIHTHFISANLQDNTMLIKPARTFGNGLEIICRFVAYGSFIRRYGMYAQSGRKLDGLTEITLKDDDRGDPLITDEALAQLNIMTISEYNQAKDTVRKVAGILRDDLAAIGLELYDIKFELGLVEGRMAVIDDISGGNMRVFKEGQPVDPLDLADLVVR